MGRRRDGGDHRLAAAAGATTTATAAAVALAVLCGAAVAVDSQESDRVVNYMRPVTRERTLVESGLSRGILAGVPDFATVLWWSPDILTPAGLGSQGISTSSLGARVREPPADDAHDWADRPDRDSLPGLGRLTGIMLTASDTHVLAADR